MPTKVVIEDLDRFYAFLAQQPLCKWATQKQQELAAIEAGIHSGVSPAAKKNDNAELAAALSSMA